MDEDKGKFEIKEQKADRDILQAGRDIIVQQAAEKEKIKFPLAPGLHNQTPPEVQFVGREEMLKTITKWYESKDVRVGALIGWGGVGKSALVRKWYDSLNDNEIRPDGIFWWGFYRNAYLEQFLNALLRYVSGGQIEPDTIKSTWGKVERIKEYILEGSYLIILDGLEEMQKGQISGDQFGCMEHRECTEMLRFLTDTKGDGLCLITTRYPVTDIKNYEGTVYQKEEIERLSIEDARALFEKVGIKGSKEEIDSVIEEYGGHALSLTLLSKYLVEDFEGDITKAKDIPPFHSDEEAGGKAHRILLWYSSQLTGEQQAFMKIFSLFRKAIQEKDFEGVFRAEMETEMNQPLIAMKVFAFKRMVDNLFDRRLISKNQDNTYATHPLIKNYFESIFDEEDKKLCHKRIYHYFGEDAPESPKTLEEMQPLFEQVYHGCAAGLYNETLEDVYNGKIFRGNERFLIHKLGAWETNLSIAKTFFPEGDLLQMPLVSKNNIQSWLLNEAGLTLLNIGRPKEAERPFLASIHMDIEAENRRYASAGYQNLADLQFRMGELESGLESAQKALEMSEKVKHKDYIIFSKALIGWMLHLLGKSKESDKELRQADELCEKTENRRLYSYWGIIYADYMISMKRINAAFKLTELNFKRSNNRKNPIDISRCHRCLGAIERIKGNNKEAQDHLQKALEGARKVGMPELEIDALLEFERLWLDMGKEKDAIRDAEGALKICGRTGFRIYEPGAEIVLGKAYLAEKDFEQAGRFAKSAYDKAVSMKYRWAEGDAGHLLGEVYLAKKDKVNSREWLEKVVKCRKEILDPNVKETEKLLRKLGRKREGR